jgi:16S rRNA (guanine1207-N2)-methyltransferase
MSDAALETLFWPFTAGHLQWPATGALFLRARDGAALRSRRWPGLVCEQSFKPDADALARAGYSVNAASTGEQKFALVLLLPPRQRDEGRALMARAVDALAPGGHIVAAMSNNEGARSGEADLAKLIGPLEVASKHKCRVFWSAPQPDAIDANLLAQWRELDAARPIENGRFVSRPGVFAWDRIDAASALLAEHLPSDLAGDAADLGAGFGYLTVELLERCPRITSIDLYEAEQRALDLARINLESFATRAKLGFHWHDVTAGLPRAYDVIVTNPPFHAQRGVDRPDIGRRFIEVAAESLQPGGQLWLVANRHLPYEVALTREFRDVRTVTQQQGYKIVAAIKSG